MSVLLLFSWLELDKFAPPPPKIKKPKSHIQCHLNSLINNMMMAIINLSKCDRGGEPMMMVGEGNPEIFALKSISNMILVKTGLHMQSLRLLGMSKNHTLFQRQFPKLLLYSFPAVKFGSEE